ncbi:MAG: GH92 family glycosyl hydrolase [Bythopirellula sp.]
MHRQNSLQLVNPLQGSNSRRELSTGNTYPAVGVPRGMTYWTPQTSDGRFIFDHSESEICGIRATHAPSPWMGDYGHFDIFPIVGPLQTTPQLRGSAYDPEQSVFAPHRGRVRLLSHGVDLNFSASSRCAVFEMEFPSGCDAGIVLQTGLAEGVTRGEVQVRQLENTCEIQGVSYSNHGGCPENYGCYFVAEIKAPASEIGVFDEDLVAVQASQHTGPRAGALVRVNSGQKVVLRVATSFISIEQARLNLQEEIGTRDLVHVAAAAHDLWSRWLAKVEVEGGTDAARQCFATAMYRVGLFPMCGHESDGGGGFHHRSPYDGQLHAGKIFTNNGFWDTHRTVYPLLALIDPEGYGEIVNGFLQAYRQTGWLPKWASPGYRDSMISTHVDAVISEAVLRGIPGFDYEEAYQAIYRNAFDVSDEPTLYGRSELQLYDELGYVPADIAPYSVSRTLDFSHCDWCVAQVALALGHDQDAEYLLRRSKNYRNLWHASSQLMRPKDSHGNWQEPWDQFTWGHAYIEGGAWQHSFNVPHDPQGLADLFGGVDALIAALDRMLELEPMFHPGSYQETIHEMTEMATATDQDGRSFGQYAHSNEPAHGYLWYPAALGISDWTSHQVDRVMRGLYTPDSLAGDEDNGEMSAWYVLAAMGQFPLCGGSGCMVSAPCRVFDQVIWQTADSVHHRLDGDSSVPQPKHHSKKTSPRTIDSSPS